MHVQIFFHMLFAVIEVHILHRPNSLIHFLNEIFSSFNTNCQKCVWRCPIEDCLKFRRGKHTIMEINHFFYRLNIILVLRYITTVNHKSHAKIAIFTGAVRDFFFFFDLVITNTFIDPIMVVRRADTKTYKRCNISVNFCMSCVGFM